MTSKIDKMIGTDIVIDSDDVIDIAANKVKCGPYPEKCGDTEAGFYQCSNHWDFYHPEKK